jgi:hypothetical protein
VILDTERLFFVFSPVQQSEPLLNRKPKRMFKNMLLANGNSGKVADELWKWYDFSKKKGVASF